MYDELWFENAEKGLFLGYLLQIIKCYFSELNKFNIS